MNLRTLRRRLTPAWLSTSSRRRWRDILLRRCGLQRCYAPPLLTHNPSLAVRSCLPYVVALELLRNPRLTFLQIGAFDGTTDDDLHDLIVAHRLRGVIVEPQPAPFARLRQTYSDQLQVTLLECAIAERQGVRPLYSPHGSTSMIASLDRWHLRRHGIAECEIVGCPVACRTVESALDAAKLTRVDLIQIDAEGYDWPIIRSINLAKLRPRILRFEFPNMPLCDADACLKHLAAHGYRFIVESRDIIAHLRAAGDAPEVSSLATHLRDHPEPCLSV